MHRRGQNVIKTILMGHITIHFCLVVVLLLCALNKKFCSLCFKSSCRNKVYGISDKVLHPNPISLFVERWKIAKNSKNTIFAKIEQKVFKIEHLELRKSRTYRTGIAEKLKTSSSIIKMDKTNW